MEYFPFGEAFVEEASNTQRTPYLFTAKELVEETGLYYFGARYYDPRTSVWQSTDPILASYMQADIEDGVYVTPNLGLYSYSHNRPLNAVDPDGNFVNFVLGGAKGLVANVIIQRAEMAVGLRDEFSWGDLAIDVAIDTATSGTGGTARTAARVARVADAKRTANRADDAVDASRTTRRIDDNLDIQGGPHSNTSRPRNDGLDSHHCPAKACYSDAPISSMDGPAMKMEPGDHRLTASYGRSSEAQAYRARQQELLSEGRLMDAIDMDVRDIRSKFGNKYDGAISEMLDYARTLDPNDFRVID